MDWYERRSICFQVREALPLACSTLASTFVFVRIVNDACEATHHRNFPSIPFVRRDVHTLSGSDICKETGLRKGELDLLIGGPPCQGFSIVGQRQLWDPRNGLFREFMRIADELKPRAIVIENVTGPRDT